MPKDNIDDFNDAMRYATRITGLHSQIKIYDDEINESLTGSWGSRPLPRDFSIEPVNRFIQDIKASDSYIQDLCRTDNSTRVCEVCGEPLHYSQYHICNRCRLAAQKFKDCLTEEDLGRV